MKTEKLDWVQDAVVSNDAWAKELGVTLTVLQQRELSRIDGAGRYALGLNRCEGNTFLTAFIASRWILSHPYGQVVVICPTMRQAESIWIFEFKKVIRGSERVSEVFSVFRHGFGVGGCNNLQWGGLLCSGQDPLQIQGICRENLLMIVDGIHNVSDEVLDTAKVVTENANGLWVAVK